MFAIKKVATYGQIAGILGTRDSRRVGQALHANKVRRLDGQDRSR